MFHGGLLRPGVLLGAANTGRAGAAVNQSFTLVGPE